jgi:hypothetical protein
MNLKNEWRQFDKNDSNIIIKSDAGFYTNTALVEREIST